MAEMTEWKERLLEEFRQWLETLEEEPETELPEEEAPDLASFFGELSALREEVRQQSRSARGNAEEMLETMEELQSSLTADSRRMAEAVEQVGSGALRGRQAGEEAVLKELLSLREALAENVRLLDSCSLRGLFVSRRARNGLRSAQTNERLLAKKTDEVLRRYGVEALVQVGKPFDALMMRVIATVETDAVAPGCVAEIFAQGYRRNGQLLQTAEVSVRSK